MFSFGKMTGISGISASGFAPGGLCALALCVLALPGCVHQPAQPASSPNLSSANYSMSTMADYISDEQVQVYSLDEAPRPSFSPGFRNDMSEQAFGVPSPTDSSVMVYPFDGATGMAATGVPQMMPPSAVQQDYISPFPSAPVSASPLTPVPDPDAAWSPPPPPGQAQQGMGMGPGGWPVTMTGPDMTSSGAWTPPPRAPQPQYQHQQAESSSAYEQVQIKLPDWMKPLPRGYSR